MKYFFCCLLTLSFLFSGWGKAEGALSFTLEIIAETGDTIGGVTLENLDGNPSLNNNGIVAFFDVLTSSENDGKGAIFTQNSLIAEGGVTNVGGNTITFDGVASPSINDNGDVVFAANFADDSRTGIFTQNSLIAADGDTIDENNLTFVGGSPSINDNDDVAFFGFTGIGGIFTQNSLLAADGDTIGETPLRALGDSPSLNNNGNVTFFGIIETDPVRRGIFTQNSLIAADGDTIDGKTLTLVGSFPSINDNDNIAFFGGFPGGYGIFMHDFTNSKNSLIVSTEDTIDGKTLTLFGDPSLNNKGDVAFTGDFSGGNGIFTQNSFIAGTGTIIDAKTLADVSGIPSINDNGDVAFIGNFADGSQAIILAKADLLDVDDDGDGFSPPEDCDDNDDTVYPGALELCDGKDNDCDGIEDNVMNTYWVDGDGDGYGDPAFPTDLIACTTPIGYSDNSDDCNDSCAECFPGNPEVCDELDNNCDGQVDEGVTSTYYLDSDEDGYGDPDNTTQACIAPDGYVEDNTDCNDDCASCYPDATEIPNNGMDEDCNSADLVAIDIDPKHCPNKLKIKDDDGSSDDDSSDDDKSSDDKKGKGNLKVAILGTQDFDVRTIDVTTLNINGVTPVKSKFKDVTAPSALEPCDCEKLKKDKIKDLELKFDSQEIIATLGAVHDGDIKELTLTGNLLESTGGTAIEGKDCVRIKVKKGHKGKKHK